ncbi:uncharacterized protein BDR25DRAFT_223650 [Lindgomyces ingoldianus]|uniref:Uncharacterized protein n=1 Tax=Lindgomyces ingoldianus TaxID=673940 RepID=A0ACB6QWD6_9PLEO|nr:uncharacterized protein BDR25DRAFT_223650 [Lindgomyces ingoldianus]KAF2471333.1 hypothetical protein BDR25DRAFT_223650 [Lindgomyces ingoldianus]
MAVQRTNERQLGGHSAEHHRRHRQRLVEKGTVKKEHADSTKVNIYGVMQRWTNKHCKFLGEDRLSFLVKCTKEDIMTFLTWLLDLYPRIRKRSSLHEYWRVWRMLYQKSVGHSLHAKVREEVNDYIDGYLTKKYNLDTTAREKPVMNVDDVYLVLHHHWVLDDSVFPDERQRLQLALLLLLSAYTATRPAALVYAMINKRKRREHYIGWEEDQSDCGDMDLDLEDIKTLCYEDVKLLMLPNPEGKRDILVMEVTLRYTKGHKKRPNPKTFILTEVDALLLEPIMLMITIALLDNAFESKVRFVEEILRIRVRAPRRSLEFCWRSDMLKTPIFRQAERITTGIHTSPTKALRYYTYLYYLQRLGLRAGFMQILTAYAIRRGAGEAVEAVATQPQLQQVISHKDAGVYQVYINQRVQCDVQAAFLIRPSSTALFKAVTHMSRYMDPRAPTDPTPEQVNALKVEPEIVQLRKLRDQLSAEARRESGTFKAVETERTKMYQMYKKAEQDLRCAKAKALNSAKRSTRQRFFDTINTIEIDRQLNLSLLDLNEDDWEPEKVEHQLEERRVVAQLICKDIQDLTDQCKFDHRIRTVNALIALCQKKEAPRRQNPDRTWGVKQESDLPQPPPFPVACARTQCLFCFWNAKEPFDVRLHHFSTLYKARDHVERHLNQFEADGKIPCPDPGCQKAAVILHGHMHFKSHAARKHDYDIFRRLG